jgi:hypothetical protein
MDLFEVIVILELEQASVVELAEPSEMFVLLSKQVRITSRCRSERTCHLESKQRQHFEVHVTL